MSFLSALKYKITINRSYYAGAVIFLLYNIVIVISLLASPLSIIPSILHFLLFLITLYATKKAYLQSNSFMLSESGLVERMLNGKHYYGKITRGSFYNGFFVFLILEMTENPLMGKSNKQFITIYHDAVSEYHYRLLARLIISGRN